MTIHPICVCISTGRCGTTFLADALERTYRGVVPVHHETLLETAVDPRRFLNRFDVESLATMRREPEIRGFLDQVRDELERGPFVDTGNNIVALFPLLVDEFPGRVRALHLVRDPVTVAASFTNFTMYAQGTETPDAPGGWWNTTSPPNPRDTVCAHPEYAERWDRMTPFEKNLWRWGEFNLFGLEFHRRYPDVPYLRMTSNELFRAPVDSIRRVMDFYGLPPREPVLGPSERQNATHVGLRNLHPVGDEWRRYAEFGWVLNLARELDVPVSESGLEARMVRYGRPTAWELWRYRARLAFTLQAWLRWMRPKQGPQDARP